MVIFIDVTVSHSHLKKQKVKCIAERKRNVFSSCCLKLSIEITMYGYRKTI